MQTISIMVRLRSIAYEMVICIAGLEYLTAMFPLRVRIFCVSAHVLFSR